MAEKKKMPNKNPDDNIIYMALADLAVFVVGFFVLRWVERSYGVPATLDLWETNLQWFAIIFGVGFAVSFVMSFAARVGRKWWIVGAVGTGIVSLACLSLNLFWALPIPYLYFLLIAGCALYLIWLLYPADFFTIALLTTLCGSAFFLHGQQSAANLWTLIRYFLCAVLLVLGVLVGRKAAKKDGKLTFGKTTLRLYRGKAGATPLYVTCAVWVGCIAASLVFGPVFAYYCVFAAAGYLFLAACYYTIRLT